MSEQELFRAVLLIQQDPQLHPLTCAHCSPPQRDDFPLVPWIDHNGEVELRCPLGCGWRQTVTAGLRRLILEGARIAIRNIESAEERARELARDVLTAEARDAD